MSTSALIYWIAKTGLGAFDTARAWGCAVLVNALTQDEVEIEDRLSAFAVRPISSIPPGVTLSGNSQWSTLFSSQDTHWQSVFATSRGQWEDKRNSLKQTLEGNWQALLQQLQAFMPTNMGSGETLPGSLEPSGFKSLRHTTRARYAEENLAVPAEHWALACLGMATCGTYRYSREAGQTNWLALLPVPQQIRLSSFRSVQSLLQSSLLSRYRGVQNAAAHYAVQLMKKLRDRAAAQGSLQDRFSAVLYFRLFGAGQQLKPAQGNQLNLAPLMNAIQQDTSGTEAMLEWLDNCFQLGAADGAEELALAATELVMRWDLDSYERLVKVQMRVLGRAPLRRRAQRNFDQLLWCTKPDSLSKAMEVVGYAQA